MTDEFAASVRRLVDRVHHWTPSRWAASSAVPGPDGARVSRAALVHGLVQRLADAAADAEGRAHRPVPRLDSDLTLVDQVRVMAADLAGSGAAETVRQVAAGWVDEVRRGLSDRVAAESDRVAAEPPPRPSEAEPR